MGGESVSLLKRHRIPPGRNHSRRKDTAKFAA
jgi:hypothetical protein